MCGNNLRQAIVGAQIQRSLVICLYGILDDVEDEEYFTIQLGLLVNENYKSSRIILKIYNHLKEKSSKSGILDQSLEIEKSNDNKTMESLIKQNFLREGQGENHGRRST